MYAFSNFYTTLIVFVSDGIVLSSFHEIQAEGFFISETFYPRQC